MNIQLNRPSEPLTGLRLSMSGSKSESNRLLVCKALYPDLKLANLSDSDDTESLRNLFSNPFKESHDIGHAGTAMRFGLAYLASLPGCETELRGSARMHERPIKILVDALDYLGADIEYLENYGYPPVKIRGQELNNRRVAINGSVSSQYLTALLLIAPRLKNGLLLTIEGQLTSRPYLDMTVALLKEIGVDAHLQEPMDGRDGVIIEVESTASIPAHTVTVESDWSSAGYWYSWVALQATGYSLTLEHYKKESLQGDSALRDIYQALGVETVQNGTSITLIKKDCTLPDTIMLDMAKEPDQAQTLFATCLGLGINAHLTGLHTLRIKETDRIEAMKEVGSRFRESVIKTSPDTIELQVRENSKLHDNFVVNTFKDHRMAMAFAPLCMLTETKIMDAGVVSKSYPNFWEDMRTVGCRIVKNE